MATINYCLLADEVIAEASGKQTITGGGLHAMAFDAFPSAPRSLAIPCCVSVPREEFDATIIISFDLIGPDGVPILPPGMGIVEQPLNVSQFADTEHIETSAAYFVLSSTFAGLVFPAPGDYAVVVRLDGVVVKECPLHVKQR